MESSVSLNISPSTTNLNTIEGSKKLHNKYNNSDIENQNNNEGQTLKSIIV
jgi:hypothetical protein